MTAETVPGSEAVLQRNLGRMRRKTSQLFFWLLLAQWLLAVALAFAISRWSSAGNAQGLRAHVYLAVFLGGALNAVPLALLRKMPESTVTRHVVAVAQMLWSALLIEVTGGRIETHFHIFGSLAFLAFYRDWRVLPTAAAVVLGDHLLRGLFWPVSVYGVANPEWWRILEHLGWIAFEGAVLIFKLTGITSEMRVSAEREVSLENLNGDFELKVRERTADLRMANDLINEEMNVRLTMEAELRQAQKLESVGRLAAGVAHEINTPVQFVSDSIHFLKDASADLFAVVEKLKEVQRSVLEGNPSREAAEAAAEAEDDVDLSYLAENVPKGFERALEGLTRVATIVRSMKEFAHPDTKEMSAVDLNRAIESTLTIARNEYKYVAEVETSFAELPHVLCHAGDLNQAILNIVVNAAHAIGDVVGGSEAKGRIGVSTRRDDQDVVISISDTGRGIPSEISDRIFDPFFTTKPVGKGTGQGLAIARSVIVEKHGGQLTFETAPGQGTTFFLRLPIEGRTGKGAAA
jgi:signal transduction histidine kinase